LRPSRAWSSANYRLGKVSMNLVGKIFVVLILVMSVLFMAFAMAVYATHRNWREVVNNEQASPDKPLGLTHQLKKELDRNNDLKAQTENLKKQIQSERNAKIQAVAKLESELKANDAELKTLQAKLNDLERAQREAVAAVNTTQADATEFRKQRETLRTQIEQAQKDRDAHFNEVVRLTEELNQAANEKDLLKKRTDELTKDLTKADKLLQK
jgi:chromosome segregation ATPase